MTLRGTAPRAACVAALFVALLAAPAASQQPAPRTGTLPGGVVYTLAADPAQPAAAVALWFRGPDAGFGTTPVPGLARVAAKTVAASSPITGTSLAKLVTGFGGRLSVAAYPQSVAITALVPPARAAEVVRAMTADFFAPVVADDGLQTARREVEQDALYAAFDPEQSLEDALGAALFASGPLRAGTIATPQAVRGLPLSEVRGYAERVFRPANAILVVTGNADASVLERVATRQDGAAGAEAPLPQRALAAPAQIRRDAFVAGIGLGWVGPPIATEADATALDFLADAYFSPRSGIVTKALAGKGAVATGKFVTYHDPGVFLVTISGDDAAAARPIVERLLAGAAKPLDRAAFAAAQAAFVYDILQSTVTPHDLADTFGWYAVEGDPAYAPAADRYLKLAAELTPAAVARVAARYLAKPPGTVTFTRSATPSGGRPA